MRPNRDGKAVVPGKGGYDSEVIEVTGPPDRMMAMPPAKSRGKLIPMGDGEGLPYRPGPGALLRKRVPLVPTSEEVARLPRWARVAFAARCARRVQPALSFFSDGAPEQHHLRAVANHASDTAIITARNAPLRDSHIAAHVTARTDDAAPAAAAAAAAARFLFETATLGTPLTAQLRCIRRDFARLKRLAREQKWTDDTPVPPEVFGPMWPEGVAPDWAVEPPQPPPAPRGE